MASAEGDHSPRDYQLEMLRQAKNGSVIIKLNTGSGKTFIAVLLIKELLPETERAVNDGGKRIVFLVTTVHLVSQQAAAIRRHTSLNDEDVGEYHGDSNPGIDYWQSNRWEQEFNEHKILVFTAGIFKDILNHAKYSLRNICLLVFDECHHSAKDSDYSHICRHLNERSSSDRPKILGLTASVVNGNMKESQIAAAVAMLEMRMNARLITSTSSLANAFGDRTQETLAFFDPEPSRWARFTDKLQSTMVELQEMVRLQREALKSRRSLSDLPLLLQLTMDKNLVEKAKRGVSDCLGVLTEVGPWGALTAGRTIIADLEQSALRAVGSMAPAAIARALAAIRHFVAQLEAAGVTAPGPGWRSKKVDRLLELLQAYFAADASCRGIVFAERRVVCFALCSLLEHEMTQVGGLRPAYITGHGAAGSEARESCMVSNQQLQTVRAFRVGEKNLLVATKVVEEGMDVQACNMVIKFDCPNDYRSFVQSKGRARAQNSTYVIFIPRTIDNGLKERFRVQEYTRVTEVLNGIIENRAIDRGWYDGLALDDDNQAIEDEILNQCSSVFQPHGPQGPRITLNSAIGIINRYIGRLRHDCFFAPRAHIFVLDSGTEAPPRACVLLPFPCPLRQPIVGPPALKAKRARKWAALEACKTLFEAGELGEDLLPFPKKKKEAEEEQKDEAELEEEKLLGKIGSRRRRRSYEPEVAAEVGARQSDQLRLWDLSDSPSASALAGKSLSLFVLQVSPSALNACHLDCSASADLRLALLLPSGLDPGPAAVFPLFFPAGPSGAAFEACGQRCFAEEQLVLVERFHCLAVSCLLGRHSTFALDLDSDAPLDAFRFHLAASRLPALCAVLTASLDLATEAMTEAVRFQDVRRFQDLPRPLWAGALLRARHYDGQQQHQRERWAVRRVAEELSPLSPFPDPSKAPTYAAYFKHAVTDPKQPLLEVVRIPTVPETALFRHPEAAPRTHRRQTLASFLLPDLCDRYPLPVGLWLLVAPLPAALCRLQQLLGAARLHREIWPQARLPEGPPALVFGAERHGATACDLSQLLAALTAIECRDFQNLERLELMGDSFLKFAASVALFAVNEGPSVKEGDLTQRRKGFISNSTLFRCAIDCGIHVLFRPRFFNVATDFWPPGYVPKGDLPVTWKRFISDKALADCVEAIIGYAVVQLGHPAALRTLRWFGIDPGFESNGFEVRFPPPPEPWLSEMSEENRAHALERLSSGLDKVETIIGYKFRRKEFLVQALTHASSVDNLVTECYQKLEYLGDAVVDFLVTQRIFHDEVVRSPGELSDLRSALVNNITFAAVVVRAKLHKFLRHAEPRLFRLIPEFEAVQEERAHRFRHIEFLNDNDGNVTMKILGDLFESIAGAIFVDSGFSLEIVDNFVSNLMKDVIDDFSKDVPKNPVRVLHEKFPGIKFSDAEKDDNTGLTRLSVTIKDEKFSVVHRNKKTCKRILALRILDNISA